MTWREYCGADLRTARGTRVGAILVHAAVAATVGVASAISGAAVALHLGAAPQVGQYIPRHGGAAAPAAIPAAPVEKPMIMEGAPASTAQARTADSSGITSDASSTSPAAAVPRPASPSFAERELTFAWGYAQRHPGAPARQAEAVASTALASATAPKRTARRPAERQRTAIAQHQAVGLAPSAFFPGFNGDAHQALGYAQERHTDGFAFSTERNLRPTRATTALPSLRNHDKTRS
jgi:hypothetical protein